MLSDFKLEKEKDLTFGLNSQQTAQIYKAQSPLDYEILSDDDELLYNEIIDLKVALDITSEFYDVCAVTIVKAAMPCGVALGRDIEDAYVKAFDCDPISSVNGVVAFSKTVDEKVASQIKKAGFCIVASPDFSSKALDILRGVEGLKIVKINTSLEEYKKLENVEIEVTPFGILVQSQDRKELDKDSFKVVSKRKPTAEEIEDAVFAWKIVKHAKSEAVVIAKDFKTLAISQGNTCRVCAIERALDYACNDSKDAILASDGIIPAIDSIFAAVQGRISLIIQTGNGEKSIISAVDKYNTVMIETGISHLKY